MKKLQNNFTTHEQSKRLLELGVPADSADMYIPEGCTPYVFVQGNTYSKAMKNWGLNICDNRVTPCWSVGRLIEIAFICSVYEVRTIDFWRNDSPMDDIIYEFENNKMDFSKLD